MALNEYYNKDITIGLLVDEYNNFSNKIKYFDYKVGKKRRKDISFKQKRMLNYYEDLKKLVSGLIIQSGSGISREVKILTKQQMFSRLPILLAQIQAGNNSKSLKNELRQLIYSLYRPKALTKTVYNNLIKVI